MRRWLVFTVLSLTACGPDDPRSEPEPEPGVLELRLGSALDPMAGTGGFRTVEDGAELPLRPGSQGGFHVFVNVRLSAAAVERVSTRPVIQRSARRASDGFLFSRLTPRRVELIASSTVAAFETEKAEAVFLCPTPVAASVADELLELTVDFLPDYDEPPAAQGRIRFVPVCTDDERAFCEDICYDE